MSASAHTAIHPTSLSPRKSTLYSLESFDVEGESRHLLLDDDAHGVELEVPPKQERLTFPDALRLYPAALAWSVYFSLGVIMTAFDQQLLGSLFATPAFQRDFGYEYQPGQFTIKASWQTALTVCAPLGQAIGAFTGAYAMELFGCKKTLATAAVLTSGTIFFQFLAESLSVLFAGELLGGIVLGVFTVIAPTYASEVCPLALRGMLTSYVNLCWVLGQLIATALLAGTSRIDTPWAYRAPFAAQWFWPAVILTGLYHAPESPWWLVGQGRHREAKEALRRLASAGIDIDSSLALIVETYRSERNLDARSTYKECFRNKNLRRTKIAIGVYSIQVISGVYLVSYATYFFTLAGLSTEEAFNMGVGFTAMGVIGTLLAWMLLLYFGRRTIYNTGLSVLVALLFAIGIIDCAPQYSHTTLYAWAQSVLMLVWNLCYGLSIGPICFVIACEVPTAKLRSRTIALGTSAQTLLGTAVAVAIPYLINADEVNARGKIGFFFGGFGLIGLIWSHYNVPETSGRTYEELDILFDRQVGTRDFASYVVGSQPYPLANFAAEGSESTSSLC